jgi:hypothetical protein
MVARLAIRSFALSALALLVAWYALLGGRAALEDALPEIGALAPPAIVASPPEFPAEPLGWLIASGTLFAAVAILAAAQRSRRSRYVSLIPSHPLVEEKLWAEHLAWLKEQQSGTRGRVLVWPGRVIRAG